MNPIAVIALSLGLSFATPDFVSEHPHARPDGRPYGMDQIDAALADPARLKATKIVFVGDSITAQWLLAANSRVPEQRYGLKIWNESFNTPGSPNYALNLGISGDRTENVLYRIQPKAEGGLGELDAQQLYPDAIVLMIGVNNAYDANKFIADSVFAGVRALIVALHERKPWARIVVQSILPVKGEARNKVVVQAVNKRLKTLVATLPYSAYCSYLDLYPAFVDAAGQQDSRYFDDGLHPNEAGYKVWRDKLVPLLASVRRKKG